MSMYNNVVLRSMEQM